MMELLKTYQWPLIGGVIGLIIAILFITIGFFSTLLVIAFVALGIVAGSYVAKSGLLQKLFKQ